MCGVIRQSMRKIVRALGENLDIGSEDIQRFLDTLQILATTLIALDSGSEAS